jgi:hypothetical protein
VHMAWEPVYRHKNSLGLAALRLEQKTIQYFTLLSGGAGTFFRLKPPISSF